MDAALADLIAAADDLDDYGGGVSFSIDIGDELSMGGLDNLTDLADSLESYGGDIGSAGAVQRRRSATEEDLQGVDKKHTADQTKTRASTPCDPSSVTQAKRKQLVRVKSKTGRPEEIYHTIRKKGQANAPTLQVSHYMLATLLGKGAFGKVYQAMDRRSGQFFAVKRMKSTKCDINAIEREIGFLRKFKHQNIVGYIESVRTDNHINVVLEYVDQKSLSCILLKFGMFPENLAAIYVAQVLDGLKYLHDNDVIHLDIKAANILINTEGVVKLADFGIATTAAPSANDKRMSVVACSPFWTAPEVIMNQSENGQVKVTPAADIWSLGCTIIELVTGYPPYHDMSGVQAIFKMVDEDHPPFPDDVSEELLDFLLQCFQKEPSDRPTAAQLRSSPWIRKFTGEPVPEAEAEIEADAQVTLAKSAPPVPSRTERPSLATGGGGATTAPLITYQQATQINLRHTMSKEEGKGVMEQLKKQFEMEEELERQEAAIAEEAAAARSSSSPSAPEALEVEMPKKKKKKFYSLNSKQIKAKADEKAEATAGGRPRKNTKSLLNPKKAKIGGASQVREVPDAVITLHIHSHENRRNIFAYTVYNIAVSIKPKKDYTVEKTYTVFKELHDKLVKELPSMVRTKLPPCPPKRFWGQMDPDFISKRTQDLQVYLNELVMIPEVRDSSSFQHFISTDIVT